MAEDGGQEKTEDATPKRLRDARKKGQVAKSRDLNTVLILIVAFVVLVFMQKYMGREMSSLMKINFDVAVSGDLSVQTLFQQLLYSCFSLLKMSVPFLLVVMVAALAIGFFQVGPIFSTEPLLPQMKRLNAVENLKNMFKMTTFVELIKNIAKISLIFLMAYLVVKDRIKDVVLSIAASPIASTLLGAKMITSFLIKVFIIFIAIAVIDLFVQRWQYKKQLRMTKDEVKREYKQDEGDPLIKSARRQFHRELANSDTNQSVRSADAVIVNPTEVAVAIKYDDTEMAAPQVVAKGQRLFAQAIREIAEDAKIPIIRNVPLAWTLIEVDIGEEIPEEIYAAVAEILVQVYKLKKESENS